MVSPASIVENYGADTARCYILFMGPPDQEAEWSDEGVDGVHRFLSRLWRLTEEVAERREGAPPEHDFVAVEGDDVALLRKTHWAIDKATNDMRRFTFNTAIAAVMELLNECSRLRETTSSGTLVRALDRRIAALSLRAAPRRRGLRATHR